MIKKYRSISTLPKPKKVTKKDESSPAVKETKDKLECVSSFLDCLRVEYENDYRVVHQIVLKEAEEIAQSKLRGFGKISTVKK